MRIKQTYKLVGRIENGTKAPFTVLKLMLGSQAFRNVALNNKERCEVTLFIRHSRGRTFHIDDRAVLADKLDICPVIAPLSQAGKITLADLP